MYYTTIGYIIQPQCYKKSHVPYIPMPKGRGFTAVLVKKGIVEKDKFSDYTADATRAEMAYVLANALPEECYAAIGEGKTFSDVPATDNYYAPIIQPQRFRYESPGSRVRCSPNHTQHKIIQNKQGGLPVAVGPLAFTRPRRGFVCKGQWSY